MNIKTVSYRRTKNLGNYESKVIELVAELDKDDTPEEALHVLADFVDRNLGIVPQKPAPEVEEISF